VWLRLVERLHTLRDPDAVAGWLATSTRNECIAVWRARRRQTPVNPETALDLYGAGAGRERDLETPARDLLLEERRRLLAAAVEGLPGHCRQLLSLLFADPPLSYEEISERLDVSRGYIGPTRARCLTKLRDCPALAAYLRLERDLERVGV
jgi:RNA polymerase sigma factor (sigma-70 family)